MTHEVWTEGRSYEAYIGRWSRLTAVEFVKWLGLESGLNWLEVGCGTGALSQAVLDRMAPETLLGIDRSSVYASAARDRLAYGKARFAVGEAQALPVRAQQCDVAISALVLNFVPQPERMIQEMLRSLRPGGRLALYVWDYGGKMELIRYFWNAAVEVDRSAETLDEARRFPLCRPQALRNLLEKEGARDVEVEAIDVATRFRDFEDYWAPFLMGQGPGPGYVGSLKPGVREQLQERLRMSLPQEGDGSINLVARAWAVRGVAGPTV